MNKILFCSCAPKPLPRSVSKHTSSGSPPSLSQFDQCFTLRYLSSLISLGFNDVTRVPITY